MSSFRNLASHEFDSEKNLEVKTELQIANIPVFELPQYMNTEVKTKYMGLLNGFVFYRAWRYWVCIGYMPIEKANEIYKQYKHLAIRAGGHCDNIDPNEISVNPVYEQKVTEYIHEHINDNIAGAYDIIDDKTQPRFVKTYHIDTQLGLNKLVDFIRVNNIQTENLYITE